MFATMGLFMEPIFGVIVHRFGNELCSNGNGSKKSLCYNVRIGGYECGKTIAMAR